MAGKHFPMFGIESPAGFGHFSSVRKIIVSSEYCDDHLVAVNKPAGLLTVPGRGPDNQDCLFARTLEKFPDALVVHRLDMGTSGLVLFARSAETQRALGRLFENREVSKTYIAVVEGVLTEDEGQIELPLRKDMEQRLPPKHLVDCVRGKQAVTNWRVLERLEGRTRLELVPMTGRSHQLRVHMQSLGFPIVGDPIYGTSGARLMLHAETLAFRHPADAEPIRLECPAPF